MTNYLIGGRCSGKTTRLIERSAKEGSYILVATKAMARCVADQAKEIGLEIPYPITVGEYLNSDGFPGSSVRRDGLLIDELDLVLNRLFHGIPIREVTLTDRGNVERLERIEKKKSPCQGCVFDNKFDLSDFLEFCFHCKRAYKPDTEQARYYADLYTKEE